MNTGKIATWAAFGAAALMAGASNAGASDVAGITYISLDGLCDVLTLTVFPWHQAGEYDPPCNGQGSAVGSGMEGKVTGVYPKDLTIAETYSRDPNSTYLWNIQYPLATGNTYSIYQSTDGVNFSFYSAGTYTIVGADAAHSHRVGPSVHRPLRQ